MATPILYNLPESKGTGKSFAEVMGFFIPAYIIVSIIFIVFKITFEPTVIIFIGFFIGIILIAIDFPTFYNRFFKVSREISRFSRRNVKSYKFFLNMFKDPKYSTDLNRYLGYSNCFIHLGPGLLFIGLIHLLSYFDIINIDINYGIKTGIGLTIVGLVSIYASYRYRIKMYATISYELENFNRLSEKNEGDIDDYYLPNAAAKEEEIKNNIDRIEMSVKLLKANPTLVSKESVNTIIIEKNQELEKLKKSRLEFQLNLYKEIFEIIEKIKKNLSNIKYPAQLNSLDIENSKIKKYICEAKEFLAPIDQQLHSNKLSSDYIPLTYRKLQRIEYITNSLNEYIDFESYSNKINDRILKIKTKMTNGRIGKLTEIETEVNIIHDYYINYNDEDEKFPPSYEILKKQETLQKIEKKINEKFKI